MKKEQIFWIKVYKTFNDDNEYHASCAFISNGLHMMSEEELRRENKSLIQELLQQISVGELLKQLPEAAEYLVKRVWSLNYHSIEFAVVYADNFEEACQKAEKRTCIQANQWTGEEFVPGMYDDVLYFQ